MKSNVRSVHSPQALAVYAESLAAGGRVAVFGDSSLGVASRLASLGARDVRVWDPDRARARLEAARAPENVTVEAYAPAGAPSLEGMDLAIVPDLGLFEDAANLIARVRDVVGDDGIALIAAANREGQDRDSGAFDYYELFDLVANGFEDVRMIAQMPFYGVALVRLGDDDDAPSVSVDTQLAPEGRLPDAFVVLASRRPMAFDPYAIIELPEPPSAPPPYELEARCEALAEALEKAQSQEREAQRHVENLQTELRARNLGSERASARVLDLESSLLNQSTRCAELEAALVERARHLSDLSTEVEEMRTAAEAGRIAAADIEQIARRADRAERRLADVEQDLGVSAEKHSVELARFEEGLRERARLVQSLESELARRDKMVRELVSALEEAEAAEVPAPLPAAIPAPLPVAMPAPLPTVDDRAERALTEENARLRDQLNVLALDLARREGEAQAMGWTVAELERRLALATAPVAVSPVVAPEPTGAALHEPGDDELRAALDELDALRRALAQEHEARGKAESAEKVARALLEERANEGAGEEAVGHSGAE